jgi:hypothetical protein
MSGIFAIGKNELNTKFIGGGSTPICQMGLLGNLLSKKGTRLEWLLRESIKVRESQETPVNFENENKPITCTCSFQQVQ